MDNNNEEDDDDYELTFLDRHPCLKRFLFKFGFSLILIIFIIIIAVLKLLTSDNVKFEENDDNEYDDCHNNDESIFV